MDQYTVNFIGFGNVRGGRCIDAETQLNQMVEHGSQVMTVMPYTLVAPGKPTMNNGLIGATPPKMISGFVVVTKESNDGTGQDPDKEDSGAAVSTS